MQNSKKIKNKKIKIVTAMKGETDKTRTAVGVSHIPYFSNWLNKQTKNIIYNE